MPTFFTSDRTTNAPARDTKLAAVNLSLVAAIHFVEGISPVPGEGKRYYLDFIGAEGKAFAAFGYANPGDRDIDFEKIILTNAKP